MFYYCNKTYLLVNEKIAILKTPKKIHEIDYSKIEKIVITPFGNDVKKIEILYNKENISLYGFENLKEILTLLEMKIDKNRIFIV